MNKQLKKKKMKRTMKRRRKKRQRKEYQGRKRTEDDEFSLRPGRRGNAPAGSQQGRLINDLIREWNRARNREERLHPDEDGIEIEQ